MIIFCVFYDRNNDQVVALNSAKTYFLAFKLPTVGGQRNGAASMVLGQCLTEGRVLITCRCLLSGAF
jgi:hypothetical protein